MAILYEDEKYYHVYNRGAHREAIFFTKRNYVHLLYLMDIYKKHFSVSVIAYCLMPNHYHFILRQEKGGSISRFIQTIFNAYTQAINKERGHTGTLFESRAKSVEVDTDRYVVSLVNYIHLNPLRASLVQNPEEWEYSSCKRWLGMSDSSLCDCSIGDTYFKDPDEYRKYLQEGQRSSDGIEIGKYIFEE